MGGLAGMSATLFVQPLDLVKTRMQLTGEGGTGKAYRNAFHAITSIVKAEGVFGLYAGLSAGLLRQAVYTTARMGIYTSLVDLIPKDLMNFFAKLAIGIFAGGVAAFIGTPTEVALIRMTADGKLPVQERRGYKNVFECLIRIIREESVFALWKGALPTVIRAMVLNGVQLSSYSQAKEIIAGFLSEGLLLHFIASMISGLLSTIASMPVDIVKTRMQKSGSNSGPWKIFTDVIKKEGFFSLWKGFLPYYARLGPHTVLTFIFLEQYNNLYKKFLIF